MGTTPTYSWPYPESTDPVANGAQDIEDLALAIESTVSGIGGKILQVVQTVKTDGFSTTSTSHVDVTGLNVSITPGAATSKVMVFVFASASNSLTNQFTGFQLVRGTTDIAEGTSGTTNETFTDWNASGGLRTVAFSFLDTPATTSSTTYKVQMRATAGTSTLGGSATYGMISSITVMEVAA